MYYMGWDTSILYILYCILYTYKLGPSYHHTTRLRKVFYSDMINYSRSVPTYILFIWSDVKVINNGYENPYRKWVWNDGICNYWCNIYFAAKRPLPNGARFLKNPLQYVGTCIENINKSLGPLKVTA